MKTNFFMLLCFIFSIKFFSQKSIECTYNVHFNQPETSIAANKNILQRAVSGSKNIEFKLLSNKNYSQFSLVENLSLKEKDAKIALVMMSYENYVYCDLLLKEVLFNNSIRTQLFEKNEFIITRKIFSDWILTSESKSINKMLCFKAFAQLPPDVLNNDKSINVIAWYCPSVPFSSGPNGFGGLPGLIFELQVDNITYGTVDLKLLDKDILVIKPTKGTKIDVKTYFNKMSERINNSVKGM